MSILIKGMEMPTSCFYCPMRLKVDPDTIKCLATGERFEETFAGTIEMRNRGNCPLVVVPDHGRLIDADKLMLKIYDYIAEYGETDERGWHTEKWCAMKETEMAINNAPTIIPADKEEQK